MKKQLLSLALLSAAWLAGGSIQAWDQPSQVDGVWQLGSVNDVEWYSDYVDAGNLTAKAVLTADIDYTGQTHTAIGRSDSKKYQGVFDGQGHRIMNLTMTGGDVGFFNQVRGEGTVIKNLIIDSSCSFEGTGKCAALIAQPRNGKEITIYNVVNLASVKSGSGAAGGLVGNRTEPNITALNMSNCVNAGTINSTGNSAGAFVGWVDTKVTAKACYNIGEVQKLDGNKTNLIRNKTLSNNTITNCYDLKNTTGTQGIKSDWITADPVHSGELCYVLNNGDMSTNGIPFTQDLSNPNSIPLPIPGPTVYQVADLDCAGNPKGSVTYSNTEGGSRDPHQFNPATGFCTVCGALNEEFVAVSEDGFYHLSTVAQVEWFSQMVRLGHHGGMDVKLDADIDFGGVPNAHLPIGTSGHKYWGHFDGQGHRIIGMVLNNDLVQDNAYDGKGFFGSVRGGGTDDVWNVTKNDPIIENLIIDESCSIVHNQNFAAGVVAHINSTNSGVTIIIRNCGNEANVTTSGKNAAGILGCVEATNVGLKLYNLWNKGKIVGNGGESAAICAWTGQRNVNGEVDVEGCWNIGEVTGIDDNHYNMIRRNSNIVPRNIVDLCIANGAKGNQGTVSAWNTSNPISSGELCYLLNGDQTNIVYTQTLSTDNMPVYGKTSQQVYASGLRCDGAGIGFTNTETDISSLEPPHHTPKTNGFCSVCNQNTITSLSEENGYLLVSNAAELEFLSSIVNAASGATKNAKLTANIDMDGVTHTPIGYNNNNKFCGEFDGQGHSIFNMSIYSQNSKVGVFGALRGGTLVKNLIVDASCQITGVNHLGGIAGSCQAKNNSNVTVENCINEASIHGTGYGVGGIIGQNESSDLPVNIINCGNSGSIQADDANACAVIGWAGGANADITINNFWNTGKIIKGTNDNQVRDDHEGDALAFNFFNAKQAAMDANIHLTNCYDASPTEARSQGILLDASAAASGELTYKLGGDWKQLIGTDVHPVFVGPEVLYVGAAGYTTMYDANNDWDLLGDAQAYIGTINGSALHLDEIDDIPAGTAVVIGGTYYNKLATTATANTDGNALIGSTGYVVPTDKNIFALAQKGDHATVGFYPVNSGVIIPAGKAYLDLTGLFVKEFLAFAFNDDATSIQTIGNGQQTTDGVNYNLAGQRVQKMQKGINIVNGKKILK